MIPIIAWDSETVPFSSFYPAPPPVCLSWCDDSNRYGIVQTEGVFDAFRTCVSRVNVGHNLSYDLACFAAWYPGAVDLIYDALDMDRVVDTMIIERLSEIYRGNERGPLGLAFVGKKYGLPDLVKDDVQTSYGPLLGRPLSEYSREQIEYSINDSIHTYRLFRRQESKWLSSGKIQWPDVCELTRRSFWLQICRCWGLRTDPDSIDILRDITEAEVSAFRKVFKQIGFLRPDNSKNVKAVQAAVSEAYDGRPPFTKESNQRKREQQQKAREGRPTKAFVPQISTARGTLEESGDPRLEDFARYGETAAVLNKDLPMLERGVDEPIHTRWGIASSLRTTSSDPNVQNFRRSSPKQCAACGKIYHSIEKCCPQCSATQHSVLMGIRECIIPLPGNAFVGIDHSGLELCTLAQQIVKLLGLRRMADDINRGLDLHSQVGCLIAKLPYDEFRKLYKAGDERVSLQRNCGKVYQFGRHGGMGAQTLVYYAKQGYHIDLTLEFCKDLIRLGAQANPDGAEYLRAVDRLYPKDQEGRYLVQCWGSGVIRGGCTYSAAANHPFQTLGAIIESKVGHEITREQLTGRTRTGVLSPLWGTHNADFVHDEFLVECPIDRIHEVDVRLHQLLREVPRPLLPDVQIKAESAAMDRYSKKAKRIENANGILQVWKYAA